MLIIKENTERRERDGERETSYVYINQESLHNKLNENFRWQIHFQKFFYAILVFKRKEKKGKISFRNKFYDNISFNYQTLLKNLVFKQKTGKV
jgi:hypothetical protein